MMMLFMTMMTLSFIFMWLKHPISMGITIIAQTIIVAMMSGMMMGSFWYSYMVMITMLSGMLVLFMYMASVASNEKLYPSIKLAFLSLIMIILMITLQLTDDSFNNEMTNFLPKNEIEILSLNSLFNSKTNMITIMMVFYLLFTMITVSSIVNISEGPLRMYKK
nr:NADH-ubiquinone oxidoreductase chain 6 [Lucullia flavovittata]